MQARTTLPALSFLLLACGTAPRDPQLGEEGRLRFVSSNGCNTSTLVVVGGSAEVELQSATEEAIPGELSVASDDASVLSAAMALAPNTIELRGLSEGESRIEVRSSGDLLDALVFGARPATRVVLGGSLLTPTPLRAFAGATAALQVSEVWGECPEGECQLLGESFLDWRVEPEEAGAFVIDFDGTATFRMNAPGSVTLRGSERAASRELVNEGVEVVATSEATALEALLETITFDPEGATEVITLPGEVDKTDGFALRLHAVADSGLVPIAARDVFWRFDGEEIAAPVVAAGDPYATFFVTGRTGATTIVAVVPLLDLEQSFALEVK
jgi:hypothetical protein